MSVKNVISWHSAFTCSFGTLSPGLKSYLVHQVVKWEKSTPITPWWPTLKTKDKVIFWIFLRILHQISVTAKKLITCFKNLICLTFLFISSGDQKKEVYSIVEWSEVCLTYLEVPGLILPLDINFNSLSIWLIEIKNWLKLISYKHPIWLCVLSLVAHIKR